MKPLLLDLFCGGGGCAKGYMDAGFYVIGVDIVPQPHYVGNEFYQEDAPSVLDQFLAGQPWHGYHLSDFAVIHASPVCKSYSWLNGAGKDHPRLILTVKERLRRTGLPWVIENVMGAAESMPGALMLCGSMFGLAVERHRLFESNIMWFAPGPCRHSNGCIGVYGHSIWDESQMECRRADGRNRPATVPVQVGRAAMDIDWMSMKELSQAIPPAYTRWIGQFLIEQVERCEVAG